MIVTSASTYSDVVLDSPIRLPLCVG
jgi:hypothetical protein